MANETARTLHRSSLAGLLLAIALLAGGAGAGCGRTELDLGFPDADPPGGAGGSGGRGGGGAAGNPGAGGATGQAGAVGTAGTTGAGGTGQPLPLACGEDVCAPGIETCCVESPTSRACIAADAPCSGLSISCLDGAACSAGNVCCASVVEGAASCVSPSACAFAGGLTLCANDAQCPASAPSCCRGTQAGVCARTCP